jgi:hypothetical protein
MRLVVFVPILVVAHLSQLIAVVEASGKGDDAKGKGKPAKEKGKVPGKKGVGGKKGNAGVGKGNKGGKRAPAKPLQLPNFDDLQRDMHLPSARIGKLNYYRMEMPASTHILRVRSKWGDECADYYKGLENSEVSAPYRIGKILEKLEYEVCEEPQEEYSFEEFYYAPVIDYRADEEAKKQSLVCTFQPKDPKIKRIITVARESALNTGFFSRPHLLRRMKRRLGEKRDALAESKECLSMLDQYIRIQNSLADAYEEETGIDTSKLKIPEIVGASVTATAQRKADEENTDESSGLGAGYIVLIIFGVLVALGGGYYAFTKCSSKGQGEKNDDIERGEKRKRRGDRNRNNNPDARVVQVVGRPVPI